VVAQIVAGVRSNSELAKTELTLGQGVSDDSPSGGNLPMSGPDSVVPNEIVKQKKAEQDPAATDSEFREFFSAQQILRDYQLARGGVKFGIAGQESNPSIQGTDGGIDSMYLIVNGKLIRDTEQSARLTRRFSFA
jgi:hypothetical protein